jgi:formate C-acetyltransferase
MNENVQYLIQVGEPFAAGLLEYPEGPLPMTYCRAYRRYYETCPIVYRSGAPLFPAGVTTTPYQTFMADGTETRTSIYPHYAHQYWVNWPHLEQKDAHAAAIMRDFATRFRYAGEWNHSMLNYKRILAEGIDHYEQRLLAKEESDFRSALLDLIAGLRTYHRRAMEALPAMGAPKALLEALARVPFSPAETAYEAIVALNFCLSLDGWDNVGRLDSILAPYHRGEDMRPWMRCMMINIQENDRWSITLGPDYSEVTRQALEASVGLARPLIQLRVTQDMPEDLWALAAKRILEGGGQPAFYNEKAIRERLMGRIPHLTETDALEFSGGGCTETAFAGCTYSGGTDDNINVLQIFEQFMHAELPKCADFDEFYEKFMTKLHAEQDMQMATINAYWNRRAKTCFAPIRTLFIDDCIDRGIGWFQGGARYTFSIHSDSGIPNTIDSLLAIRHLVYDEKRHTPAQFLALLTAEDPTFFAELKKCPAYGTGDPRANALVHDLTSRFYGHYLSGKLDLGLGFFPTAHQFTRHVREGAKVGATPDGRRAGMPEADSLAPVNGKAIKGPTVMLADAALYEQKDIYGMAVTNLSITKKYPPQIIRALAEGYFALGGTQLQITAVDRQTLLEAREDPDSHRDLIVRVGGYSDYFRNLTDQLKDAVVARTLFEL